MRARVMRNTLGCQEAQAAQAAAAAPIKTLHLGRIRRVKGRREIEKEREREIETAIGEIGGEGGREKDVEKVEEGRKEQ